MSSFARGLTMLIVLIQSYEWAWLPKGNILNKEESGNSEVSKRNIENNLLYGVILARKGSKGIPEKNMVQIGGKPLIHWALTAMIKSEIFTEIWVSTDDPKVENYTQSLNFGIKIHKRAAFTATDEASSITALQEFLSYHPNIELLALVQCTSPFIIPEYLVDAFNLMATRRFDSIFSVTRTHSLKWSEIPRNEVELFNKYSEPLNFFREKRPRRQDWSGELVENGMFYFTSKYLVEKGILQGTRSYYVEIPKERSLELDNKLDLIVARHLMNEEINEEVNEKSSCLRKDSLTSYI